MKKPKIYIAVPEQGWINAPLVRYLFTVLKNDNYEATPILSCASPVDFNRNSLADSFLAHTHDYIFWIDSDVCPPEGTLEKLLRHDKDIVCGAYHGLDLKPERQIFTALAMKKAKKKNEYDYMEITSEELQEIDASGLGCCLVKRKVMKDIVKKHGCMCRNHFAKNGELTGGEDYDFFIKAKAQGYKAYMDPTIVCSHYKEIDFKNVAMLIHAAKVTK